MWSTFLGWAHMELLGKYKNMIRILKIVTEFVLMMLWPTNAWVPGNSCTLYVATTLFNTQSIYWFLSSYEFFQRCPCLLRVQDVVLQCPFLQRNPIVNIKKTSAKCVPNSTCLVISLQWSDGSPCQIPPVHCVWSCVWYACVRFLPKMPPFVGVISKRPLHCIENAFVIPKAIKILRTPYTPIKLVYPSSLCHVLCHY